jgi:hypothetical protein
MAGKRGAWAPSGSRASLPSFTLTLRLHDPIARARAASTCSQSDIGKSRHALPSADRPLLTTYRLEPATDWLVPIAPSVRPDTPSARANGVSATTRCDIGRSRYALSSCRCPLRVERIAHRVLPIAYWLDAMRGRHLPVRRRQMPIRRQHPAIFAQESRAPTLSTGQWRGQRQVNPKAPHAFALRRPTRVSHERREHHVRPPEVAGQGPSGHPRHAATHAASWHLPSQRSR